MSIGRFLLVLGSILAFGLICFVSGIEFKAGNKANSFYVFILGFLLLDTVFNNINAPNVPDDSGNTKKGKRKTNGSK
jgi:hypothetical protein